MIWIGSRLHDFTPETEIMPTHQTCVVLKFKRNSKQSEFLMIPQLTVG